MPRILSFLILILPLALGCGIAKSQPYPSGPVTFVVP